MSTWNFSNESAIHVESAAITLLFASQGVTFDSGGYNIKAGAGSMIEQMKYALLCPVLLRLRCFT